MLGAMVGDIAGSRFEFNNYRKKDFELLADNCFVTDDTVMTLAIAKAVAEGREEMQKTGLHAKAKAGDATACAAYAQAVSLRAVQSMREVGQHYPGCGYGGQFMHWMFTDDPQPYNSFGNGAAMRVSPAGFMAVSLQEALLLSEAVTGVTHNHPEGIKGANATAAAVYLARTGSKKVDIAAHIRACYYPLDFTIDSIRDTYMFNETCQDTVPQAIQAFLEADGFEDAIRTAVSVGGDSDTLAAITGSIAQAYYGVPEDIKHKALGYLDDRLLALYHAYAQRCE